MYIITLVCIGLFFYTEVKMLIKNYYNRFYLLVYRYIMNILFRHFLLLMWAIAESKINIKQNIYVQDTNHVQNWLIPYHRYKKIKCLRAVWIDWNVC